MELAKYSMGVGDRFGHQAKAQLAAIIRGRAAGVVVAPVWNKSNREHTIIGTEPAAVRRAADAAARALCGHEAGIACIMGTGSNSCLYDGKGIAANVSPLGFILGDEGSGAVLGKLFLGDVLKNQVPREIAAEFLKEYDLDLLGIIRRVYREPQANRFLASVTPFISKHIAVKEIHDMVLGTFTAFFRRNVMQYTGYEKHSVNFVGSIAHYFRPVLEEAAAACGLTIGTILKSPMDGLLKFHSNN